MTDESAVTPSSQIVSELAATWRSYLPDYALRLRVATESVSNPPITQRAQAVVLFADVVGFTAMTESFAGSGAYGTEQLTRIINHWFELTADTIARSGGSVVDFAGDALVGTFLHTPEDAPEVARRAIECAELIRAATAAVAPVETPDGPLSLTIRIGLAGGPLQVMLVGDPAIRLQHLIAGQALDDAIDALHRAGRGEIIADEALRVLADKAGPAGDRPGDEEPPLPGAELERLLKPFLHPAIRQRLRSGRHELVNEHRKVTTAFVRLPDLSADDPGTVQALQDYLAAGVGIIDRYGGHLRHLMADDKGTVLVAVFGTPVSHEDDEERALRCCLELLALPGGPYRGGVTTGPVYCGEVGSDVRREYAVVGDAVNLAARLMQAAPARRLLIDQATYDRTRDLLIAEGPRFVTAKGKAEPVPAWTVVEVYEAPAPLPSPAPGPVVGRSRELAVLDRVVREVHGGAGRVVWLHGEAGVGKSRLAAEMCRLTGELGFTGYGDSCRSHGTSASYLVWRSIWRELLEIAPELPIDEQRRLLTERSARYDGSGQRAPLLAAVINLPMDDTELTAQLDVAGRDHLLRSTLLACLFDRAAAQPLILLLEDCHWIDPASLTLLDLISRHIADVPVLILATSREPLPYRLSGRDQVVDLPLASMTDDDADRLTLLRLRERYGPGTRIAAGLVRSLREQTGGNAFYIEELVSYLHLNDVDPGDPGALAELHPPGSLQRLVMARIDQLTDAEKAAIKVASVIGRRFRPPWIHSVYPAAGTRRQLTNSLRRLHNLDLTPQVEPEPEPEYEFKHPITQETAYQSITYDTRATLHERVGLFIESAYPDRLPQYVDVLAFHYARTGRVDKQRFWYRAAGDRAKAIFANEAATYYYGRLLPLLPRAEQAELHIEIGTVHQHTGEWSEAEDHYRRAMLVAGATGRADIVAAGQRQLGDLLMYTHSYAESVTWLERAIAGFESLGDEAGLSRTMDRLTFALYRQGSYPEALAMAERHLALATRRADLSAMSAALGHIGLVHLNSGRLEEARDHLRRSLTEADRAGDRHRILHTAGNLGWAAMRARDHAQAIASYRQAMEVAREIGARHEANVIAGNVGEIYRKEGDYARARKCAMRSLRVAVELRDTSSMADQVAELAAITAGEGRPGEAQRLLERAIEMARALDAPYFLCDWLHRLARLHLAEDRPAVAERLNSEALRVAEEHGERDTLVSAFIMSVRLRAVAGEIDAARAAETLREAATRWTEPHERAAVLDAVWQADPEDTEARDTAADIYRTLYRRAPSVDYREAYRRLTGTLLPPGPILPELPDWIAADDGADLETLLRQAEGA
ncbi:tetratricopeptide repeat protein [Actinoplanes sp. NPDC048796]|uniref:tetratricopeptide repeat protein n=1 Tax=Actinoplanes sp. NPDC048796 TaxID=3155640 RepID=UPI0033FCB883